MALQQMRRLWYNRPERHAHMAAPQPGWPWFTFRRAPVEDGQSETRGGFLSPMYPARV